MYFPNYGVPKTSLDKYQKNTSSEHPWTSKMINQSKHYRNLNGRTFIKFIDHCEGN